MKSSDKHFKSALGRASLGVICLLTVSALNGCSAASGEAPEPSPAPVEITEDTEIQETTEEPEIPEITEPEEIIPETIEILGTEYELSKTFIDLSDMTSSDVTQVTGAICSMPELETVNLMPEEGDPGLTLSDVYAMKTAAPAVHFVYDFDLFGQRLSTATKTVKYVNCPIGNEGVETIRQALVVLDRCEYFLLDDCGIDDEIMAGIRDDFPDTKVVWRIHVGTRSALTDYPIIRMTHGITDEMTGPLQYCTEVEYMDLGHDGGISDISFIANMPHLKCVILSDARITDLSPITNCHELEWLELVSCGRIQNLEVIADMDSIRFLNISWTRTQDLSGIWDMELERFCCIDNYLPQETIDAYREAHPDCISVFSGNPYGYGWRYDDYGYHFFSYYARMREVFRYDQGSPGGFVWPEDE